MSQRQMAARALGSVLEMKKEPINRKLKTLCMKTPALLQQSGLAQTVVFLRSREVKDRVGETYVRHLVKVMGSSELNDPAALQKRALEEKDLSMYIALTNQAQQASAWLRRFAQIEMADIDEEDSGDERH